MSNKKKFDFNYLLLILIAICFLLGTMKMGSFFGSKTDWLNQHVSFPEYFRTLFYSTGNFFPSLALNIGGGENIYNISYYGLYSPLLFLSYLLPFIKMINYIEVLNILIYISMGMLTYKFLKDELSKTTAFFGSVFLLLATPLLFHIHRHYMFVNYFPFLIISLMTIKNYFKKGVISPFIIANTLLIFTSYYYSITCILVEIIYFIYIYLQEKKINFMSFIKKGIPLGLGVILAIGISAILLLPTLAAIKGGRGINNSTISLWQLLTVNLDMKNFLYDFYGLGLSFISILAILYFIFNKKTKREMQFLSIALAFIIFIPIFMYLLNGKLYIRAKVLIPFIILIVLVLSKFLEKVFKNEKVSKLLVGSIFIAILSYNLIYKSILLIPLFIIDFIIVCLFLYNKKKIKYLNIMIGFIFIINIGFSYGENFVDFKYYKKSSSDKDIKAVLDSDKEIYRMKQLDYALSNANNIYSSKYYTTSIYSSIENKDYKDFLINDLKIALPNKNKLMLTNSPNIIYDSYLGVKYIIGGKQLFNYEKVKKNIYKNNNSRSIIYATNNIINEKDYNKISYPNNLEYLFSGVVSDKDKTNITINSKIKPIANETIKNKIMSKLSLEQIDDGKKILDIKNDMTFTIDIDDSLKDKIIFLNFKVDNNKKFCSKYDRSITINDITNKISCNNNNYNYGNNNTTFNYVFSENTNKYKINIKKGKYIIKDLELYGLSYNDFKVLNNNIEEMKFDYNKTKGDVIEGSIEAQNDSYLVSSIPYSEGYTIYIDNIKVKSLKVNKAFLGSKINKGKHNVKIVYTAPFLKVGKLISFIALLLLIIIVIIEKYVRCKTVTNKKLRINKKKKLC